MSQQTDYTHLARQMLDAWQEQAAAMLSDGEFVRVLLRMMQSAPLYAKDSASYGQQYNPSYQPSGSAATASNDGAAALARIERRLADIEARLAFMESGRKPGKPAVRKPVAKNAAKPRARKSTAKRSTRKSR